MLNRKKVIALAKYTCYTIYNHKTFNVDFILLILL